MQVLRVDAWERHFLEGASGAFGGFIGTSWVGFRALRLRGVQGFWRLGRKQLQQRVSRLGNSEVTRWASVLIATSGVGLQKSGLRIWFRVFVAPHAALGRVV